jgi:hypothetical protein
MNTAVLSSNGMKAACVPFSDHVKTSDAVFKGPGDGMNRLMPVSGGGGAGMTIRLCRFQVAEAPA